MKKKGLIISTAVMVVVLIAALTTGTFAWFTQVTDNKIEPFSLSVEKGQDVIFGVQKGPSFNASEKSLDNFRSGTVNFDDKKATANGKAVGTWDGEVGLGGLDLSSAIKIGSAAIDKAVGTAEVTDNVANVKTSDAAFNKDHPWIKSNGSGTTTVTAPEYAVENTDYIHLPLGIQLINTAEATKLNCVVTITFTGDDITLKTLGLAAALHVIYSTDGSDYTDKDIYEGQNYLTAKGTTDSDGKGTVEIPLNHETGEIQNLDLYIILAGYDTDCVTAAAQRGLNVQITISFDTGIETD